jgi:hypothetical protein
MQTGSPGSTIAKGIAATGVPLHFAGAPQSADLSFDDTYPPNEWCNVSCIDSDHRHDLTDKVPAGVPVHIQATVTGAGEFDAYFPSTGVSYSSYLYEASSGSIVLDVDLVRSADGAIGLEAMFFQPDAPEAGPKLHSEVTIRSDPTHVPPGIPVALTLKPGDTVNATGKGVKGLYLIPPTGPVLRDETAPASLRVPDGGVAGTYVAIPYGTEAAILVGPGQTLQARSYVYHHGTPHDVAASQPTAWDEAIPATPIRVGLQLDCKQVADLGCSGSFRGNGDYTVAAPDGTGVFQYQGSCSPVCDATLVAGYFSRSFYGAFLDPHLAPGTYHATANVPQGNEMQATVVWATIEE